jgi:N-acyl-D-aspartate/D-glutamate deacylase
MVGLIHPRGIGTMSSFRTQMPFDRLPVWRELRARPVEDQRHLLQDPDLVARLVQAANQAEYSDALGGEARPPEYDRLRVIDRPTPPNPTVAEMAADRDVDPVELMIQLSLETDMSQFFSQSFIPFDYEDTKRCMEHPHTVVGFSDSGAHVSQMSDASIQTHLLAHWVRERQDFSLEEAVRMLTLAPARAWGFHDRGLLSAGMVADINVFDPTRVGPAMPVVVNDLPAGEKRIVQRSVGFLATIVNGEVLIADGEPTGARPGQLIRGPLAKRISNGSSTVRSV